MWDKYKENLRVVLTYIQNLSENVCILRPFNHSGQKSFCGHIGKLDLSRLRRPLLNVDLNTYDLIRCDRTATKSVTKVVFVMLYLFSLKFALKERNFLNRFHQSNYGPFWAHFEAIFQAILVYSALHYNVQPPLSFIGMTFLSN